MARPALTSDHILSERHAQHSHLTSSCQKGPALTSDLILSERLSTYIRPCVSTPHRKGSTLTSNLILSEKNSTYSGPCLKAVHRKGSALTIQPWLKAPHRKGSALTIRPCMKHHIRKGMHSHLIMEELILPSHQNGPKLRLSYLVTDQVPPFSQRMAVALISNLLVRMANTHIWHGRNLIL